MDFLVVCGSALLASVLTFFSGFGLGTVLLPVFALYFPVEIAIAATAVVHLVNNIAKLGLTFRHAHWPTVWRFGVPALLAAVGGAMLLTQLPEKSVKPVVGILIMGFALVELLPVFQKLEFDPRWMPVGGVVSGFFGGLSGHQGALRSAFLIRAGLAKESFIATGVVCAMAVDAGRIAVYGVSPGGALASIAGAGNLPWLVLSGCVAATLGALAGQRLLGKVTMPAIQMLVGVLLLALGAAMVAGVI